MIYKHFTLGILFFGSLGEAQAQSLIQPNECALVVASRRTVSDARAYAANISNKSYLKIFQSSNGWYAISIGTFKPRKVEPIMAKWKLSGKIPRDSYCSRGDNYIAEVPLSAGQTVGSGKSVSSNEETAQNVEASNTIKVYLDGVDKYSEEANKLNNLDIYLDIVDTKATISLLKNDPVDVFSEDFQKVAGYMKALGERGEKGDLEAAFFEGYNNLGICRMLISNGDGQVTHSTCTESIGKIRLFAEFGDAIAMEVLGKLFFEGTVISQSNFISADWLIKATKQHIEDNNREGALRSIEAALLATPDNTVALALMAEIFKQ